MRQPNGDDPSLVRLLIGAPDWEQEGEPTGALLVARVNSTGHVVHQTLLSNGLGGIPDGELDTGANFARSISTSVGDFDKDGLNDLAVCSPGGASGAGRLRILYMHGNDTVKGIVRISRQGSEGLEGLELQAVNVDGLCTDVTSIARILDSSGGDRFGARLAIGGGNTEAPGRPNQGAIVVADLLPNGTVDGYTLVQPGQGGLPAPALSAGHRFGDSLARIPDVSGDSFDDLAVAAPGDDSIGSGATGAVWILKIIVTSRAMPVAVLTKLDRPTPGLGPGIASAMAFGRSIASVQGLREDGRVHIAVGLSGGSDDPGDEGSVALVSMAAPSTGTPIGTAIEFDYTMQVLADAGATQNNRLEMFQSCDVIGDVDNDGHPDWACSWNWYRDISSNTDTGAVLILFMEPGFKGIRAAQGISLDDGGLASALPSGVTIEEFGHGVAAAGDADGDGVPDIVVGEQFGDYQAHLVLLTRAGTVKSMQTFGNENPPALSSWTFFGEQVLRLQFGNSTSLGTTWMAVSERAGFWLVAVRSPSASIESPVYISRGSVASGLTSSAGRRLGKQDVDGDGFDEILLSDPNQNVVFSGTTDTVQFTNVGEAYVVFLEKRNIGGVMSPGQVARSVSIRRQLPPGMFKTNDFFG